jgi:CRISPR-associated protein Csb3
MNRPDPAIRVAVDLTNPGQFFACCGLLELADRLWSDVQAWFDQDSFFISSTSRDATLKALLTACRGMKLDSNDVGPVVMAEQDDHSKQEIASLVVASPVHIRLDWWRERSLKTWAGSMDARKIFIAMCDAIDPEAMDPFNQEQIVFDPAEAVVGQKKRVVPNKREPYYFDARRGANAHPIDVGFVLDALQLLAKTHPVVEALCLVGLQRCRPRPTETPRVFHYFKWKIPLSVSVVPAAICGLLGEQQGFRFENGFRTDQRKHKSFLPAIPIMR